VGREEGERGGGGGGGGGKKNQKVGEFFFRGILQPMTVGR